MAWRVRRAKAAKEYRNRKILAASGALCLLLMLGACSAWSPILGALLNLHVPQHHEASE